MGTTLPGALRRGALDTAPRSIGCRRRCGAGAPRLADHGSPGTPHAILGARGNLATARVVRRDTERPVHQVPRRLRAPPDDHDLHGSRHRMDPGRCGAPLSPGTTHRMPSRGQSTNREPGGRRTPCSARGSPADARRARSHSARGRAPLTTDPGFRQGPSGAESQHRGSVMRCSEAAAHGAMKIASGCTCSSNAAGGAPDNGLARQTLCLDLAASREFTNVVMVAARSRARRRNVLFGG